MIGQHMDHARELLNQWRGKSYIFGINVLPRIGDISATYGDTTLIIATEYGEARGRWLDPFLEEIITSLKSQNVEVISIEKGAGRDAPMEDVYRIASSMAERNPDSVVAIGGGSTIDAVKVANALSLFDGTIEDCFPKGNISRIFESKGIRTRPMIAVQTAAGSGAENTKVALVYDPTTQEKRMVNDELLLPSASVFDYRTTLNVPRELTLDGGIDALSHLWEEFMCAKGKYFFDAIKELVITGFPLVLYGLPLAVEDPSNVEARTALGLAAGLGGNALMLHVVNPESGETEWGGTDCGHFHSYQVAKFLSHGRSCGVINPYYAVLFANQTKVQNRIIADILHENNYVASGFEELMNREIALAVAKGIQKFYRAIGFPTSLQEAGLPEEQIGVMVAESKKLEKVLQNMPLSLTLGDVDAHMKPTLEAAFEGDLDKVKSI
jgi:alcohol dehydrogenase